MRAPSCTHSQEYWEQRYASGVHSGAGSYKKFAQFKADTLNRFVSEHGIRTVTEFGCGDGNQLLLAQYPQYLGIDVSPTRSEEHTSELQSRGHLVCRLLPEKKNNMITNNIV